MGQNDFVEWYSEQKSINNQEIIEKFEKNLLIEFPSKYKKLVNFRDGGLLGKDLFFYEHEKIRRRNCVGNFLCWSHDEMYSYYTYFENVYNDPPEFFPKGLIPFAPDGGGNYICFDYRNCRENPPIVFWHHEVEENEGVFPLADSFDEFINNLKSEDEVDMGVS